MAIIYYPKGSVINRVDTQTPSGLYEQLSVSVTPNAIMYFDTSSNLSVFSSSVIYNTSSNALFAVSASYALNGGSGGGGGTTLVTGSFYPVTSSWAQKSVTSSYFNEPSASLITGSFYLRSNSGSLWKLTVFEDADHFGSLQLEGPF